MRRTKERKMTMELLAGMVADGFAAQEKGITEKLTGITEKLTKEVKDTESRLSQQITGINNRIDDLALNRATREELFVLDKRVARIEHKLGIDFKKPEHV